MIKIESKMCDDKCKVVSEIGLAEVRTVIDELAYGVLNVLLDIADKADINIANVYRKFDISLVDKLATEKYDDIIDGFFNKS